jgi:hypothetical protein
MAPSNPLEVIKGVLDDAEIPNEALTNAPGFRVALSYGDRDIPAFAHVFDDTQIFMFRIALPEAIPQEKRAEAAEFVTRANDGMFAGNFELNLDTGIVKFKTYVDYTGAQLEGVYVRNAILTAMETFEAYAPALSDVVAGKSTVGDALASVEAE